jgi:hypothetical protein
MSAARSGAATFPRMASEYRLIGASVERLNRLIVRDVVGPEGLEPPTKAL